MAAKVDNNRRFFMTLDANHTRQYRGTGYYIRSMTVILGIDNNVNLLDDEVKGAALIKEKLDPFFRMDYKPAATDPDLFLPSRFTPEAILMAAENLRSGKAPSTEAEKYVDQHTGLLILEISDVYYYRPEHSWVAQVWAIDTDHLENIGIDYNIRNGKADEYYRNTVKRNNLIEPYDDEDEFVVRADKNGVAYDPDGNPYYRKPYEKVTFKKNPDYLK